MKEQQFEDILRQALRPEIEPEALTVHGRSREKGYHMNMKSIIKKACLAAAIILMLATTAYAADGLNIRTLLTGGGRAYNTVAQAEEKAGFQIRSRDSFTNGYAFAQARVLETEGLDDQDTVRLTYNEISISLRNAAGENLTLTAHESLEDIPDSNLPADRTRVVDGVTISYRVDDYKFVPANYELTEADKIWMEQPGNFLSYGSDTVQEKQMAFLQWELDGISYLLMDMDASETAESLFSMAEELILG